MLDCGLFDKKKLVQILDQHASGLRDFSAVIWALLMFSEFISTDKEISRIAR